MNLTPHFTLEELAGTSALEFKSENLAQARAHLGKMYMLAGFAERVREIVGEPLMITSGYRCAALNTYVGGSPVSQHILGEAIDIVCRKMPVRNMYDKIKASDLKYEQMILETNPAGAEWLHLSMGSRKQRLLYKKGAYTYLN